MILQGNLDTHHVFGCYNCIMVKAVQKPIKYKPRITNTPLVSNELINASHFGDWAEFFYKQFEKHKALEKTERKA